MERKVLFGESDPGSFAGLVDLFVEERRAAVLQTQASPLGLLGSLEGLDTCSEMRNGEAKDFELALIALQGQNVANHVAYRAREISLEECCRHGNATAQVDECYQLLRVAHHALYGELYGQDYELEPQRLPETLVQGYENLAARLQPED